ncbi:uncharacterized protein LOC142817997 isoform X2 [Rhipicephalus microplus]|uniref:uncharacterized protein LOC142817997 isoform X2 n=1 Tax=Rhipicephalus microplus TaxID=6941 RepID=UPI003F6B9FAB
MVPVTAGMFVGTTPPASAVHESSANNSTTDYAHRYHPVPDMSKSRYPGPALLCVVLTPGRLPSGATDPSWVSWKKLPEPNICDYLVLDIEANTDGSYNESEYNFLQNYNTTARILFTFGSGSFLESEGRFRRTSFRKSAAQLYKTPGVRGFGLLDSDSGGTNGRDLTDGVIRHGVDLFSQLTRSLVAAGYDESTMSNFLALRPVGLRRHFKKFARLLAALNGVVDFLILLSISAPRPICFVEGLSAWKDHRCFIHDDVQPTFELCLQLISSVQAPASRFALTLSLRIDVFVDVDRSPHDHPSSVRSGSVGRSCYARTHRHIRRGVCAPVEKTESDVEKFTTSGRCNFDASLSLNEWQVKTFETRSSIIKTMQEAHQRFAATNGSALSWLIYNVTSYVADDSCPVGVSRIHTAWKLAQRFRQ